MKFKLFGITFQVYKVLTPSQRVKRYAKKMIGQGRCRVCGDKVFKLNKHTQQFMRKCYSCRYRENSLKKEKRKLFLFY